MQAFDLFVVCGSLLLATVVDSGRFSRSITGVLSDRYTPVNFLLLAVFLLVCHFCFSAQGLYQSRRLSRRQDEGFDILIAVSLCSVAMVAGKFAFNIELLTRYFAAIFWLTTALTLILSRLALRKLLARLRSRGHNLRHVLMVGTNERAMRYARTLESKPDLGYALVGFADERWSGIGSVERLGYAVVSDLAGCEGFLRGSVVDEVVVALPVKSHYEQIYEILRACERQGITVRFLSGLFNLQMARAKVEPFEGETVLSVYTGRLDGWPVLVKQALDVTLAGLSLVLLLPVFIAAALAIKLTSAGPVFFVQERVGIGKRRFCLYKFRTMVADAERRMAELEQLNEASGPVFKVRNDPRITPIGRFLRKTSIDELPQLLNVLIGDMSLVGPRPLPVRDYIGFDEDWHRRRFSVRPGITCLWQVNGRSNIGFDEWMKLDMQYIDHWSFWLDLKILLKTVPAVIKGSGAA